ncbi:MAG: cytochrome c biogenesis protein CcsA, partial [Prolixibacteraceae bacterium]|nr:cytochrome c biogenesis protein CcsA [Prolixibacteraceae bacterium]
YQSSFDDDKKGSWLSVNHDPWGIPVTYSGYLLLALSMIGFLVLKRETFRKLIKATSGKSLIVILFLMIPFSHIMADDIKDNTIQLKSAEKMVSVPIVYKGRIAPFNTMALDFTKKIINKKSYKGLTAEQVVISIVLHPAQWMNEKIIYVKNERLRKELGLKGNYLSMNDLYQGNNYRLQEKVFSAQKEMHRNKYQKSIIACDEKVALITMLTRGTLYKSVPKSVSVDKIHLRAEVLYNKLDITPLMFKINITLGFFAFFIFVLGLLRKKEYKWISYFTVPVIIIDTVILTFLLGLRWYVSGHMPLSNGYETMNFMAWCILIISFFLYRYSKIVPSATLVLSGFVILVSSLGTRNPQITNLMPVLQSPWLSSHVSVLMISYALLSFTFINSLAAVIIRVTMNKEIAGIYMRQLKNISYLLLFPAVFLLGIGIFLGAVWANVSWG